MKLSSHNPVVEISEEIGCIAEIGVTVPSGVKVYAKDFEDKVVSEMITLTKVEGFNQLNFANLV